MEQVKLLSMTTMLTVLIWAGADSLVNETAMIRVSIDLMPPENISNNGHCGCVCCRTSHQENNSRSGG